MTSRAVGCTRNSERSFSPASNDTAEPETSAPIHLLQMKTPSSPHKSQVARSRDRPLMHKSQIISRVLGRRNRDSDARQHEREGGVTQRWRVRKAPFCFFLIRWNAREHLFWRYKLQNGIDFKSRPLRFPKLLVISNETFISAFKESFRVRWKQQRKSIILCKWGLHSDICRQKIIKEKTPALTSQLISISCGKWPSILIFSGFLSGAAQKRKYGFLSALSEKKEARQPESSFFNKSGFNPKAAESYQNPSSLSLQTCRGGQVSLRGLAGRPRPYGVDGVDAEAVADVAVEVEDGGVVVARHSLQMSPAARLPLVFFKLDDELCAENPNQISQFLLSQNFPTPLHTRSI